jgi:hypothetical protein
MIISKELLTRLRELDTKATPPPWYRGGVAEDDVLSDSWPICNIGGLDQREGAEGDLSSAHYDEALIAEMRNSLPALLNIAEKWQRNEEGFLGEIKRLNAENDRLYFIIGQAIGGLQAIAATEHGTYASDLLDKIQAKLEENLK